MSGPGEQKVLAPAYDPFFKWACSPDIADKSDGTVECPSGYFALIDMREADDNGVNQYSEVIQAVFADMGQPDLIAGLIPLLGIYVTTESNQGLIWVYEFDTLEAAEEFYGPFEAVYSYWNSEDADV